MGKDDVGDRIHVADFEKHNGNVDEHGTPTYSVDTDWEPVVTQWPCEIITTRGGERIRGRQVTSDTTHVFIGEYFGAEDVDTTMRAKARGKTYGINAAFDPDGDNREMRVEGRIET